MNHPPKKYRNLRRALLTLVFPALFLSACTSGKEKATAVEPKMTNGKVILTKEQFQSAGIKLGMIEKHILSNDIHAKGKLILMPQGSAAICATFGGTVEKILVAEGVNVKENQGLATFTSPEIIVLQQQYISGLSQEKLLTADYERQKVLGQEKINSGRKLEEAEAALRDIQARNHSLKLQLELSNIDPANVAEGKMYKGTTVTTPISGSVEHIHLKLGEFVEPNDILFRIVNKNLLGVELMVFEKDIPYVNIGQRVSFALTNLGNQEYEATVKSIGKTVEESARTIRVMAEFRNTSPVILPGMFVTAEIHTDEQNLDALPEEAIVSENNQPFLFYTTTPDGSATFEFFRLPVKTGFREEGMVQVEVLAPLPAHARIVVKGTYFIHSESLKSSE